MCHCAEYCKVQNIGERHIITIVPIILFFSLIPRKAPGSSETDSIRSATISKRNYGQSRASLLFGAEPVGAVPVKAPTPPTRTPPPPRYMFYYLAEF